MSLIYGESNQRVYLPRFAVGSCNASAAAAAANASSADRFCFGLPTARLGGEEGARVGGCSFRCSASCCACWRYAARSTGWKKDRSMANESEQKWRAQRK